MTEEIERSPALVRRYGFEYREALRLVPDRDLAKQVARLNLTAKERGELPFVTHEVVSRLGLKGLSQAITRDSRNLLLLRGALAVTRVLSRTIEHGIGRER